MPRFALTAFVVVFLACPALAQPYTWTGRGADNLWSTAGNWQGGSVPVSDVNTAVVMSGTTQTNNVLNLGGFQLNSLTFAADAGPFTIGQRTGNNDFFNFFPTSGGAGAVINQFSAASHTINLPNTGIELNGDLTLGGTGSGGLAIVGQIVSPAPQGRLVMAGPYAVTVIGQNTCGGITINAGTVRVINDVALGNGSLIFGGGTLQLINGLAITRSLIVNAGGGTIDANGYTGSLSSPRIVTGAGQLVFSNTAIGPGGINVYAQLQQTGGLLVTGANNTVALHTSNSYSGPTLVNDGATLAIDADNRLGNTSGTTLDNGTLSLIYPGGFTTARAFTLGPGGGTLSIDATVAPVTFSGPSGGNGSLTKAGTGTITLTGGNGYAGGTAVLNGTLAVNADYCLGTGNVTGGPLGTLRFNFAYPGHTATTKSFAMNGGTILVSAGETVTFDGGAISGATLDGVGAVNTGAASGARFVNVTATSSVAITSNSPADQFVHFTNDGSLVVAADVNANGATAIANLNGFTNQSTGTVTVGSGSRIGVANFQSVGTVTLQSASVGTGALTTLTNVGSAPLVFGGGSRTFVGTSQPNAPPWKVAVDLHGQNAIVAGGLFVNNGFVSDSTNSGATIVADYGALVKGAGYYQNGVITQNGGKFQAGNSPGKAVFGSLTLGPGGTQNFNWQINNATGVAGPSPDQNNQVSGWSLLSAEQILDPLTGQFTTGNLVWTATSTPGNQFNMALQTLVNPTTVGQDVQGPMANFNSNQYYSWKFISWQGTYTGPMTDSGLTSTVLLDATNFVNPISPSLRFHMHLDVPGKAIYITDAPEPGTLALVGLAAVAGIVRQRFSRRRGQNRQIG